MKPVTKVTFRTACMLVALGAASGCDDQQSGSDQSQSEPAREQQRQASSQPSENTDAWTFSVPPSEAATSLDDRLPVSPALTVMVPATTLFPGSTPVVPAIANPYEGDAQAVAAGKRHFSAFNCSGCHAPLAGGGMAPPLSDSNWIYGAAPAQIFLSIVHGRPEGMPAWGAMLPRKTVWELVTYIQSLSELQQPAQRLGFQARSPRGQPPSQGDGAEAAD